MEMKEHRQNRHLYGLEAVDIGCGVPRQQRGAPRKYVEGTSETWRRPPEVRRRYPGIPAEAAGNLAEHLGSTSKVSRQHGGGLRKYVRMPRKSVEVMRQLIA